MMFEKRRINRMEKTTHRWWLPVAAVLGALLLSVAGCSGSDDGNGNGDDGPTYEAFSEDCTITTGPAESAALTTSNVQQAFAEAGSGDVICLVEGDYQMQSGLTLQTGISDIEIRGESESGTVLDFSQQTEGGNGILAPVDENFTARQFTVKNTPSDAIKAQGTTGVKMIDLTVTWERGPSTENGAYGLYPVQATNVLVEDCTVSYAADAGIYLGQSDTAILRENEAFGNVVGLEIENTIRAEAYNNNLHDNSNGVLVIDLPNLMVTNGERNIVRDNTVVDNNEENFGKPGTAVSNMPAGSGILIVSTDQTEVFGNDVHGNNSVGIGIATYLWVESGAGQGDEYDPWPEGNWIHDNTVYNNGNDPQGTALALTGGTGMLPNIFWDGAYNDTESVRTDPANRNCFSGNIDDQENPVSPAIPEGGNQDCASSNNGSQPVVCEMECQHSSLPSVELPGEM